ncbi:hypothetical protein ACFQ4A_12545 [Lentibacillus salinarum]|uniref:Uncharacterized protein n=2 Tax=Lentibacillus salinarum TaxID=446820 RepID=A0ABW3ZXC7_9BACI
MFRVHRLKAVPHRLMLRVLRLKAASLRLIFRVYRLKAASLRSIAVPLRLKAAPHRFMLTDVSLYPIRKSGGRHGMVADVIPFVRRPVADAVHIMGDAYAGK